MSSIYRIRRRAAGGAAGAPSDLKNAELVYNEQEDTLYYGKGISSGILAGSAVRIGGATSGAVFTSTLNGLAPLSGGGTTTYLRADGTWAPATPNASTVSNGQLTQVPPYTLKGNNTASTINPSDLTATQVKTLLAITTSDVSGLSTTYAPIASPTFTGTATAPIFTATSAGNIQFGGTANNGFYTDGTTIAIRALGASGSAGAIYFQGGGGGVTYAIFNSGGLGFYLATTISSTLTVTGATTLGVTIINTAATRLIYLRSISSVNRLDSYDNPITVEQPFVYNAATHTFTNGGTTLLTMDGSGNATFTGYVVSTTAATGTNSTRLASTAYVYNATQGSGNIATTGGSTTLTAAQYSCPIVVLTGALTSAATIVVPNIGEWTVSNSTTGAFTTTVKTASGTGIVVPQAATTVLVANGTNVVTPVTVGTYNVQARLAAPHAAIANTETQVLGATIPANMLNVGSMIRVQAVGVLNATSSTAASSVFRLRVGTATLTGSSVAGATYTTAAATAANLIVRVEILALVTAVGSSGAGLGQVSIVGGNFPATAPTGITGTSTINTTVVNVCELTYSSGLSTTSVTFQVASIELLQ